MNIHEPAHEQNKNRLMSFISKNNDSISLSFQFQKMSLFRAKFN